MNNSSDFFQYAAQPATLRVSDLRDYQSGYLWGIHNSPLLLSPNEVYVAKQKELAPYYSWARLEDHVVYVLNTYNLVPQKLDTVFNKENWQDRPNRKFPLTHIIDVHQNTNLETKSAFTQYAEVSQIAHFIEVHNRVERLKDYFQTHSIAYHGTWTLTAGYAIFDHPVGLGPVRLLDLPALYPWNYRIATIGRETCNVVFFLMADNEIMHMWPTPFEMENLTDESVERSFGIGNPHKEAKLMQRLQTYFPKV